MLCNLWLTQHIGKRPCLFSSKFVDLRFCRWRPDTSSPWCSSSSPPSSLFAPVAQNTPAWPAPRSRHITFSQTSKKIPPGHDLNNHFISHMWWKTLQHPKQIKSDHAERLIRPPIVTSSHIKALTFLSKHTDAAVQPRYTPLPSSTSSRTWRWGYAETPPIGCTLAVPAFFSELAPPPHQLNFHLLLQIDM